MNDASKPFGAGVSNADITRPDRPAIEELLATIGFTKFTPEMMANMSPEVRALLEEAAYNGDHAEAERIAFGAGVKAATKKLNEFALTDDQLSRFAQGGTTLADIGRPADLGLNLPGGDDPIYRT